MDERKLTYLLLLFSLNSCIDPLNVELDEQRAKLIVFGEINNLEEVYTIYLSRSSDYSKTINPAEEGANVKIMNDKNDSFFFTEVEPGVYQSCLSTFKGQIGHRYRLEITTANDRTYQSPFYEMKLPGTLDSVYFEETKELVEAIDGELYQESGIRFYCDFTDSPDKDYIKIDWGGIFKFKASPYDEQYEFCWKSEQTAFEIDLYNDVYINNSQIYRHKVKFLENGFRFQDGYSFQVRMKSIDEGAYEFWELVKQQSESDGSIFSALPAKIQSNIYNVDNPEEVVLGYFFVSGISAKRVRVSDWYYQRGPDVGLPQCDRYTENGFIPPHCLDCSKYPNSTAVRPDFW